MARSESSLRRWRGYERPGKEDGPEDISKQVRNVGGWRGGAGEHSAFVQPNRWRERAHFAGAHRNREPRYGIGWDCGETPDESQHGNDSSVRLVAHEA